MKTLLDAVKASGVSQIISLPGTQSNHGFEVILSGAVVSLAVSLEGSVSGNAWATIATMSALATTDASKMVFGSDKPSDKVRANITEYVSGHAAMGTLTISATLVSGDTVVIDTKTYTFNTTPEHVEGTVKIGGSAATSIQNLSLAIIHGSDATLDYYCAASHTSCTIGTLDATTLIIRARTKGTAGNSIVSTTSTATLTFGQTTLKGGVDLGEVTVNYAPYPNL